MVKNKAAYLSLGVSRDGLREVLGLWIVDNEGAKFWLSVMNELKNRGVHDVLIAVVDGLKRFPEAITAASLDPPLADLGGENRSKPVPPEPHSLMTDVDAPLVQQVLDIPMRQRKPDVQHDRQKDDLG